MAERKITRKVISKASAEEKVSKEETVSKVSRVEETGKTKKACSFCQGKTCPSYTDTSTLRKYLTDRAKIVARAKDGLCSKHQRAVTREIKYARHLALLPFVPKV